jgi:hypothetical protein
MPLMGICSKKHHQKSHVQLNTSPAILSRVQSGQKMNWFLLTSELLTSYILLKHRTYCRTQFCPQADLAVKRPYALLIIMIWQCDYRWNWSW